MNEVLHDLRKTDLRGTDLRRPDQQQAEPGSADNVTAAVAKTPEELAVIVLAYARTERWMRRVRLRVDRRWYERLYYGPDYDIWVISWLPGQSTGFHDHGESVGAFVVATGVLEEQLPGKETRVIETGTPCAFGAGYAHDVRNGSQAPAISVHAYSPPLSEMNGYELDGNDLVPRESASWTAKSVDREWREQISVERGSTIEQLLAGARARLQRLSPMEASKAMTDGGGILVDIRPEGQRAVEGRIKGALIVERNVLEWRFDPVSSSRLPVATDHGLQVIVFCSEGFTSSLAAAALKDIGLWRATDVIGGFQAWKADGLPIVPSES